MVTPHDINTENIFIFILVILFCAFLLSFFSWLYFYLAFFVISFQVNVKVVFLSFTQVY